MENGDSDDEDNGFEDVKFIHFSPERHDAGYWQGEVGLSGTGT